MRTARIDASPPAEADFRPLQCYLIAIGVVAAATAVRLAFLQHLGPRLAYVTFSPAVIIAAFYGGFRSGSVATLISSLIVAYFWIEPVGDFSIPDPGDQLGLILFIGSSLLVSYIAEQLHRTRLLAEKTLKQLERKNNPNLLPLEMSGPARADAALKGHRFLPVSVIFSAALGVLVLIAWQIHIKETAMMNSNYWENHTYQVIQNLNHLLSDTQDLEINWLQFKNSRNPRYLSNYEITLAHIKLDMEELHTMVADNKEQKEKATKLGELFDDELMELKQYKAQLSQNADIEAPSKLVLTTPEALLNNVQNIVSMMEKDERQILPQRTSQKTSDTQNMLLTVVIGELLAIALLSSVYVILQKEIRRRSKAEERLTRHRQNLEQQILLRTQELAHANSLLQLDLEERKMSEQAKARLVAIVEYSDDAICSMDLEGIILSWNKGAERMFGYWAEEIIGVHSSILIPSNLKKLEEKNILRLTRGERIGRYETRSLTKDGQTVDVFHDHFPCGRLGRPHHRLLQDHP